MKTFQVYRHPTLGVQAVKVGFCWPAYFFNLLWMLASRLWGWAGLWFGLYVLAAIIKVATDISADKDLQAIVVTPFLAGVPFALGLVPAFLGNEWRVNNLLSRGFELVSTVQAETKDAAIAQSSKTAEKTIAATPPKRTPTGKNINWYLIVLRQYAVFKGRARRKEYWFFFLFNLIASLVLTVVDFITGSLDPELGMGLLSGLYTLAVLIPSLAVTVRRLHDTDRTGWWLLIGLVPLIGAIVLLVFMLLDSQSGVNQYGANPKGATA